MPTRNLAPHGGHNNQPRTAALYEDVIRSVAYYDTLIVLTDATYAPEAKLLAAQRGQGRVEIEQYEDSGNKITIQKPTLATMKFLAAFERAYRVTPVRVDLAADPVGSEPLAFTDHLIRHLMLRYRPPGVGMWDEEHGPYSIDTRALDKPPARNMLIYGDRAKVENVPWAHVELRFMKAAAIRAIGICRMGDLLTINPRVVFERYVDLVEDFSDEYESLIRNQQRAAVREDRNRYGTRKVHPVVDRYRANISARVRRTIMVSSQGRAQLLHSNFNMPVKRIGLEPLRIDEHLTWEFNTSHIC